MELSFIKMHGLGNDFVIFDARNAPLRLNPTQIRYVADRRLGVGCDQLVIIEKSVAADAFMLLYNTDGSETYACGNATRCVGWLLMEELKKDEVTIQTKAGILPCKREDDQVTADMGIPHFTWGEIPLAFECDTLNLPIEGSPAGVSMGNPHMVFTVKDVADVDIESLGPEYEHHPLYPERANVSFAQIISPSHAKLRVWERGAGATLACGTAACATLVTLASKGLLNRKAQIELPGGILMVEWDEATNHVWMTGEVALAFKGEINLTN